MGEAGQSVCLGVIVAPHGVRGAVKIKTFTERPENIAAYGPLTDEKGRRQFTLRHFRVQGEVIVAHLEGIADRDAAEGLKGLRLHVPRAALPAPEEDEFYLADLVGLPAETAGGQRVGTVLAVHDFGAGDVLELRQPIGGTIFLPFTREVVPVVDLKGGRLVVDPPTEVEVKPTPGSGSAAGEDGGDAEDDDEGDGRS